MRGSLDAERAWSRQEPHRHWLGVNGADWQRMEPDARLAYVEGFLAGAALSQAATGARDSAAGSAGIEELSRGRQAPLPLRRQRVFESHQ